ncbi:hypothetical protein BA6E_124345 [Bacteroidales bacterium 6E]|nr:hypothetical protein BA6E_124345 [Bacteroidales bacterium 6E]
MENRNVIGELLGWTFGVIFFVIGLINVFWGNDPGFGIFIVLASMAFMPPVNKVFTNMTGWKIPVYLKVLLGAFILWAALGVGELPDKIGMMLENLN